MVQWSDFYLLILAFLCISKFFWTVNNCITEKKSYLKKKRRPRRHILCLRLLCLCPYLQRQSIIVTYMSPSLDVEDSTKVKSHFLWPHQNKAGKNVTPFCWKIGTRNLQGNEWWRVLLQKRRAHAFWFWM